MVHVGSARRHRDLTERQWQNAIAARHESDSAYIEQEVWGRAQAEHVYEAALRLYEQEYRRPTYDEAQRDIVATGYQRPTVRDQIYRDNQTRYIQTNYQTVEPQEISSALSARQVVNLPESIAHAQARLAERALCNWIDANNGQLPSRIEYGPVRTDHDVQRDFYVVRLSFRIYP
jgi:hypothetical protein